MIDMYAACCSKCFDTLARKSVRAAKLWLDICALSSKYDGGFAIRDFDSPELKSLEENGFILTTEDETHVLVRVLGRNQHNIYMAPMDEIYCLKPSEHADTDAKR